MPFVTLFKENEERVENRKSGGTGCEKVCEGVIFVTKRGKVGIIFVYMIFYSGGYKRE